MPRLKIYRCKHCYARFVIMWTQTRSILPVEVGDGDGYDDDEIFDSKKHKSHLLTCIPRRMDWAKEQKIIKRIEAERTKTLLYSKQLLG